MSPRRGPARRRPRVGIAGRIQLAALVGLAAYAAYAALFGSDGPFRGLFQDGLYNVLIAAGAGLCLSRAAHTREDRTAWLVLGLGLAAWSLGELNYSLRLRTHPERSTAISDTLWLSFYPASYAALVLLLRRRVRALPASVWLDGLVAALAVGAGAAALLFGPLAAEDPAGPVASAIDLAYPLGDGVLLAFAVGAVALTGWRPGRAWALLAGGLACAALADGLFLLQSSHGAYVEGGPLDALWPAATLLLGAAAWHPGTPDRLARTDGERLLVLPALCSLGALGLLIEGNVSPLPSVALILAGATIAAAIARMTLTFRENARMMRHSQREALTDSLTGLDNRRRLFGDLADVLDAAVSGRGDADRVLVLFDLDGFKRYNDTLGHPAGDALLTELARALRDAVAGHGAAYRLGGDEFCALLRPTADATGDVVLAAAAALRRLDGEVTVGCSYGAVTVPREASTVAEALHVADRRLYDHKQGRQRAAASQQTCDALLQVLQEREPALLDHVRDVAQLAVAVGRRLGVPPEALTDLRRAGELHDVGKSAVPDAILNKPGPLDSDEWRTMARHTVVGERILSAAPALRPVARLVRASHECFDGSGYPDGLRGGAIPLGARILAVCDAWDAMTTDRPYQRAIPARLAMRELRRCAGTQFDPRVIEVLYAELAAGGELGPRAAGRSGAAAEAARVIA